MLYPMGWRLHVSASTSHAESKPRTSPCQTPEAALSIDAVAPVHAPPHTDVRKKHYFSYLEKAARGAEVLEEIETPPGHADILDARCKVQSVFG